MYERSSSHKLNALPLTYTNSPLRKQLSWQSTLLTGKMRKKFKNILELIYDPCLPVTEEQ